MTIRPIKEVANKKAVHRVAFTITEEVFAIWYQTSNDLVQRRIFRSKVEIFEALIYFLQNAKKEEIIDFKFRSTH